MAILTYGGNHLLGATASSETDTVLGDDDGAVFGMAEPDVVLTWDSMALFGANSDGIDVLVGDDEGSVFGFADPPVVLEWGGIVGA